jgi:hypothetical protein
VTQAAKNLAMDLEEVSATVTHLIRDRDAKFPALFDQVLADAGIEIVLSGIRVPRMNSIMERCVQSCRHELLDRTLIWNENHLRRCLPVRNPPQPAPPAPGDESSRSAARGPRTHYRSRPHRPPARTPKRPTRRHNPRVPTSCLNCMDVDFGRRKAVQVIETSRERCIGRRGWRGDDVAVRVDGDEAGLEQRGPNWSGRGRCPPAS